MNDINPNDVDRALAAFGAQPMAYRSFEKHRLPAAATHVTASPILDDTAYDPFAPQPVMHSLDERLPDVLLPAAPPVAAGVPARAGEPMVPARPAFELPPMIGVAVVHVTGAADFAAPVIAQVEVAAPVPAPLAVMPPWPPRPGAAAPAVPIRPAARPSAGLSLPTLGAKLAAREKPRMEPLDDNVAVRSLQDMFRVLNGRPNLASHEAGSTCAEGAGHPRRP